MSLPSRDLPKRYPCLVHESTEAERLIASRKAFLRAWSDFYKEYPESDYRDEAKLIETLLQLAASGGLFDDR